MNKHAAGVGNSADGIDWNDVRYVVVLARAGSLVAAGVVLGVDQTTVSRRLRALEAQLGTPLFERHQGRMVPTAAGAAVLERGRRIEQEMAALASVAADGDGAVRGLTRITAVELLVSHFLARLMAPLRAAFPELAVELLAASHTLDLRRREADIAIRLARPERGDVVIRRLGSLAYAVYGTGAARGWEEEGAHDGGGRDWVAYENAKMDLPEMRWLAAHTPRARIAFRSNSLDALAQAVSDGLGLGVLPCMVAAAHPALRRLSGPAPVLTREIWLVMPRELRDVPRVRAVAEWLAARFDREGAVLAGV